MPRRRKAEQKRAITVVIDGVPFPVVLHPPARSRTSWYAYWAGLVTSKSTGHPNFEGAAAAAERMLREWKAGGDGGRPTPVAAQLTFEELEQVQRAYYEAQGQASPKAAERARKSLTESIDAVRAFRDVSGLRFASEATPDACSAFQRKALSLPKNWRKRYPNSRPDPEPLSPSTVYKWSAALKAAYNRVNEGAGEKCVRGVVDAGKLLRSNPWTQFKWLAGQREKDIRQFAAGELVGLLDHLSGRWAGVRVAASYAKVLLWSALRRDEMARLRWDEYRGVNGEHHFSVEAKSGVSRWFRVPDEVYHELAAQRAEGDPHVFAAYPGQLRRLYDEAGRPSAARRVKGPFDPRCLGDWFYERVLEWGKDQPGGRACVHTFRKTGLQFVREGADVNRKVARDARVTEKVMLGHYVKEHDRLLHAASNRTFARVAAALPREVAARFGYSPPEEDPLEEAVRAAVGRKDWDLVETLSARLRKKREAAS